jgi:hypothetical protein
MLDLVAPAWSLDIHVYSFILVRWIPWKYRKLINQDRVLLVWNFKLKLSKAVVPYDYSYQFAIVNPYLIKSLGAPVVQVIFLSDLHIIVF